MRSMKKIIVFLSVIFVSSLLFAQSVDKDSLCPVQRWVGDMTGAEFADRFIGDTIIFSIPDYGHENEMYIVLVNLNSVERLRMRELGVVWGEMRDKTKCAKG